jgi:hypothetical protein
VKYWSKSDSEKIDSKRRFRMGEVMAKKIPDAEMPYRTLGSTKEQGIGRWSWRLASRSQNRE